MIGMKSNIRFLVMDVDGTLTDGKIYMGNDGELFKAFDIKDGCGIHDILPKYSIIPVIITARKSILLQNRCDELDIIEVHQGEREKINCLNAIMNDYSQKDNCKYGFASVAYIGDDILDLQCMLPIKDAGGIVGCPADAVEEVRMTAHFVSKKDGGHGAVRDFIEYLIK